MQNIWFSSDTHWNHKNIVKGTSEWTTLDSNSSHQSLRDFDTLEEHNTQLIKNFNSLVKSDDILYHLGDWSFGGHENIKKFRDQLHCREIHLIFGNHDQHITPIDSPYRELFSSVQYVKNIKYGQHNLFLSHYSHRVWAGSHKGVMHLYGHSHDSISEYGKSMDVGIDVAKRVLGDYLPFSIDQIITNLNKRNIEFMDHHTSKTNG